MERPLQKIREIEHSIQQIKMKISIMNRERSHENFKVDKVVNRSIPKLKVKIKDAAFEEKKEKNVEFESRVTEFKVQEVREKKFIQEKQSIKTKEEIMIEKSRQSQKLKKMSKINDEMIRKKKLEEIEAKKVKQAKIKEMEERSKQNISNFHKQKILYLKEKKKEEIRRAEKRVGALVSRLSTLHYEEKQVEKVKEIKRSEYEKLRKTLIKLERLKPREVSELSNRVVGKDRNDQITYSDAEAVLMELSEDPNFRQ